MVIANYVSGDLERLLRGVSFWQPYMFFWPLKASSGIQRISSFILFRVRRHRNVMEKKGMGWINDR